MIGWLSGEVLRREATTGSIVVNVGGVGYEVHVSLQTLAEIPAEGESISLWIHTHVREEQLTLFGFASLMERQMFRMLTSVPKVGPKNALATLGGFPVLELVLYIGKGEHDRLKKIPGIGQKTAEQIVLTLRDKVKDIIALDNRGDEETPFRTTSNGQRREDAEAMLIGLGWKAKSVTQVLDELAEEIDQGLGDLDIVVRKALSKLMEL